jgi:hypothetical protein
MAAGFAAGSSAPEAEPRTKTLLSSHTSTTFHDWFGASCVSSHGETLNPELPPVQSMKALD